MSKRLIVGNWKMNPLSLVEAKKIARKVKRTVQDLARTEAVICPPLVFIGSLNSRHSIKNFFLGAQAVSTEDGGGPFTGEVGAKMLKDLSVKYVIVGHSEQRKKGDTDEVVARKLSNVLEAGMMAIVCVGEATRDSEGVYLEGLKNQIKGSLVNIPKKFATNIILAYEPVWAIGAKEAMKPEDIYETSLFVKKVFADIFTPDVGVKATVLYGGAVNFRNAAEIISIGKVDGLLVGRESVNSAGFVELLKTVDQLQ